MFEKPSGPRSGSLDKRTDVWTRIKAVSELKQNHLANMTAKELREIEFELDRVVVLARRQWKIRTEQSHDNGGSKA